MDGVVDLPRRHRATPPLRRWIPFATPMLCANIALLISAAINLSIPGFFYRNGALRNPNYRVMAEIADQWVWLAFVVALLIVSLTALFRKGRVMTIGLPVAVTFWTTVSLTFFLGSPHGLGWEVIAIFDALLIRENVTAGWLKEHARRRD